MDNRKCSRCGSIKPIEDFPLKLGKPGYWCKDCKKQYLFSYRHAKKEESRKRSRLWSKENGEYARLLAIENRAQIKYEVLQHYSNDDIKCNCCGIKDFVFLSIDHVNGGGNKEKRENKISGGTSFYYWLKKQGFPSGYQVLCRNCNEAKHVNGDCPHKIGYRCRSCDVELTLDKPWTVLCPECILSFSVTSRARTEIEYDGKSLNLKTWSEITSLSRGCISNRLKFGWSVGQALGYEKRPVSPSHRPEVRRMKKLNRKRE